MKKQVWEEAKASNTVSVHFLGISESVFDKLEWRGKNALGIHLKAEIMCL